MSHIKTRQTPQGWDAFMQCKNGETLQVHGRKTSKAAAAAVKMLASRGHQ